MLGRDQKRELEKSGMAMTTYHYANGITTADGMNVFEAGFKTVNARRTDTDDGNNISDIRRP